MKRYKLTPLTESAKPSLRERIAASRAAAARVLRRSTVDPVTRQPEGESLTEGVAVDCGRPAFQEAGHVLHHGQQELTSNPDRVGAEGGSGGSMETPMGRHESFDPTTSVRASIHPGSLAGTEAGIAAMLAGRSIQEAALWAALPINAGLAQTWSVESGQLSPDAPLLALKARRDAVAATYEVACLIAGDLEGVGHPPAPDALFEQDGDRALGISVYSEQRHDGGRWYIVESASAERRGLRRRFWRWEERIATEADDVPAGDTISRRVPWPEAQSRADEIVAAWDGWLADKMAADEASGEAEASRTARRLGKELLAIELELEAALPHTLDGLVALASYAQVRIEEDGQDDGLGRMLIRAILAVNTSQVRGAA